MRKFLKLLIPIYIVFLLIDAYILYIGISSSGKEITLPGRTSNVNALIEIDNDFTLSGSFNTVSVYSFDRVTKLQADIMNLKDPLDPTGDVEDKSPLFDLTMEEERLSGNIQKQQSIEESLIVAYTAAKALNEKIIFDYHFIGFICYYYMIDQEVLKVGDLITKVKHEDVITTYETRNDLAKRLNYIEVGDTIYFNRGDIEYTYLIDKEIGFDNKNNFYCCPKYHIDEENCQPKFSINTVSTLGPSGGFLQALSNYCEITKTDLTKGKKIAGTGTININGEIGAIGGIEQKIVTAIRNKCDIFLCPTYHIDKAREAYNKTIGHERMILIEIDTNNEESSLVQAIKILEGLA